MERILEKLQDDFPHVQAENIVCMRSSNAKANAYARIWSLPKIWQGALGLEPHYVIEVLAQHFDAQSEEEKDKTIIHELMHIPKTFSGAVRGHSSAYHKIDGHSVNKLYKKMNGEQEKRKRFGLF